ncbi:MAG: phosphodiester glycosidase family protein [Oscillibacter sp.]|jgi:exopolysaccharide biosynthesis protein|nr:phosphodiester glycosidase family protein [Oscillibacter sp.]
MKRHLHHSRWGAGYGIVLALFTAYVLLDAFVIPRNYASVRDSASSAGAASSARTEDAVQTDISYTGSGISVTLSTSRYCGTAVYTADIVLSDAAALKTALAEDTYGKNITAATSSIAAGHGAILAINGDFYGAQNDGYVIRNGQLYRETAAASDREDLVISSGGDFSIVREGDSSARALLAGGAEQVLSFGPGLVEDGRVCVDEDAEVARAKASNPRTSIAQIGPGHYVMVVADGRTEESQGLSLRELAEYLRSLGAVTAYNLDGGGSSTLYFNGRVVNNPTGGGRIGERKVSDIVYIG